MLRKRDLGLKLKKRLKESELRKRELDWRLKKLKQSVLDSKKSIMLLSKNA